MSTLKRFKRGLLALAGAGCIVASAAVWSAATIVIVNADGAGEGFNDPTPVAPVGGNTGTTLGAQRLNAFQHAANLWGAQLTSPVTIVVEASFDPLTCTAGSAVLGAAGANLYYRDASGTVLPPANTWYPAALADKLAATNITAGEPDIFAFFNANLGQADCLAGSPFYLGLDNNHGTAIDLVAVLLHEFGHGLGFSVFPTSGNTGVREGGFPSRWEAFVSDNSNNLTWLQMDDAQRAASARNFRQVAWNGANVGNAALAVLSPGVPFLFVAGPNAVNGTYNVGTASFGPPLGATGVTADVMPLSAANALGCNALTGNDALAVNGNIALIDRGTCAFTIKVKNAQDAGAVGVVIANNAAGSPPALGGADPTITIPTVSVSQADGNALKAALQFRSRTRSGVIGTMRIDLSRLAGTDALGRVLLFTPNPYQSGSSVSHWDTIATRNLLMEPAINADLTHSVIPPEDLTFKLLQDMGW